MSKKIRLAGLTLTLALGALAGGCSNPYDVSFNGIINDMSPELQTLNQRPEDVARSVAYTNDVNGRLFWEDLGRMFYTDHPSRLNPIEIVSTSGKPH